MIFEKISADWYYILWCSIIIPLNVAVCSTHVEMFPLMPRVPGLSTGMLHARGDVSLSDRKRRMRPEYAPRTWRCFLRLMIMAVCVNVCSTHVEMFPLGASSIDVWCGMLHARGDVSSVKVVLQSLWQYAPRTWRCFHYTLSSERILTVCSTHVEMFLLVYEKWKI